MSKPDLILLPGMMCDARLFAPQLEAFADTHNVKVLPIDACDTVQALARRILDGAPPSFALAGLSMGGIVAMEVVRQAPERVSHLALLDTNPLAEKPEVAARREPQIDAAQTGRLAAVIRDEMKPNYLADSPDRGRILDICMAMALALGPEVFVRQSRALQTRPDQSQTLQGLRIPSLVLCGRHDRLCPVSRHEYMAGLIPDAELKIIDGAGHLPTLENPDETNRALATWLAR